MNNKKIILMLMFILSIFSCGNKNNLNEKKDKITVVTTTTMLTDLIKNIGGEKIEVQGLMGEGVDPHLYSASAGDVNKLSEADIIFYGGLHLEGKMEEIFEKMEKSGKKVINLGEKLDKNKILKEENNISDPHIWFDLDLWGEEAKYVAKELGEIDNKNKNYYDENLKKYLESLEELKKYSFEKIEEIPEKSRVLITAHDAFQYFGKQFKIEVKAIQGISTESEAGTKNINDLANYIVQNEIKSIFIETSIPKKSIEALKEAVKSKGGEVNIGGELYSDSLGDVEHNSETYIKMFRKNIDTIVNSLK